MPVLGSDRHHLNYPQYKQLITRLDLEELSVENDTIHEVISEFDDIADNGSALIRKFRIVDEDGVFEYVQETPNSSINNMLVFGGFFHNFLRSKELNESIDGLNTKYGYSGYHWNKDTEGYDGYHPAKDSDDKRKFDWYSPLKIDGYLASVLIKGGAYTSFDGTHAEAKELGRQFEREVIGDRHESFFALRLENVQWSEWFEGTPHWDETLILVDEDEKSIWLFMFTTTD